MPSIENVLEVLAIFESAPGGLVMAKQFAGQSVSDDEEARIFESAEYINDDETENVVRGMSSEQFSELVKHLASINEEYKESYGEDYTERVDDADIDSMLK